MDKHCTCLLVSSLAFGLRYVQFHKRSQAEESSAAKGCCLSMRHHKKLTNGNSVTVDVESTHLVSTNSCSSVALASRPCAPKYTPSTSFGPGSIVNTTPQCGGSAGRYPATAPKFFWRSSAELQRECNSDCQWFTCGPFHRMHPRNRREERCESCGECSIGRTYGLRRTRALGSQP